MASWWARTNSAIATTARRGARSIRRSVSSDAGCFTAGARRARPTDLPPSHAGLTPAGDPPNGPRAAVFSVLTDETPPRVLDRRPRLMARLLRIACWIAAPVAAMATLGAVPATAQFFN